MVNLATLANWVGLICFLIYRYRTRRGTNGINRFAKQVPFVDSSLRRRLIADWPVGIAAQLEPASLTTTDACTACVIPASRVFDAS